MTSDEMTAQESPVSDATAGEAVVAASEVVAETGWKRHGHILWAEWIKPLAIIGLVMFSFRSAVADWNDVPTGSMKPTILEGDRIFINKVAYDLKFPFTRIRLAQWTDPSWGDVVVLRSPEDGKRLVKRVVGLPGDLVEVRGNSCLARNGRPAIYIPRQDEAFDEVTGGREVPYHFYTEDLEGRQHFIMATDRCDAPRGGRFLYIRPNYYKVPESQYFVMGDNRGNSRDSRYFGFVDRSLILGQATAVALSLDPEEYYRPRWHRFFTDLP